MHLKFIPIVTKDTVISIIATTGQSCYGLLIISSNLDALNINKWALRQLRHQCHSIAVHSSLAVEHEYISSTRLTAISLVEVHCERRNNKSAITVCNTNNWNA